MAREAFKAARPNIVEPPVLDSRRADKTTEEILASVGLKLEGIGKRAKRSVTSLAGAMARLVDHWNRGQLEPQFTSLELPLPKRSSLVSDELAAFRESNVDLIQNMTEETAGRISEAVDRALRSGTRHEDLAVELERIASVGGSRARLIGRDQTLKLYGNLTEIRHKEAGITRYVWNTSLDERVRDEHRALHGTTQHWNNPPYTGTGNNHPGQDFQCRCVSVPVID